MLTKQALFVAARRCPADLPRGAPGLDDPVIRAFATWEHARRSGDDFKHLGKTAYIELLGYGISVCAVEGRGART